METVNIVIEMENGDVMKGELYPEVAPITVKNFLDLIDQDFYAAFGKITDGLEVVDKIANASRNFQDCQNEPIVIKTIKRA